MISLILSKKEREFLKRIEKENLDEMLGWKLPNVFFPLTVIVISTICFLLFKENDKITFFSFFNLLVNGSLPLLALNRLSNLGINIFKFDKTKEKHIFNEDTYKLRVAIHYYSSFLIFAIAIFYIYQVINTPFNIWWNIFIQIFIAIIFIIQSFKISKYGYILQEKMLERTVGDDIKENVQENKKHLADKYDQ